MSFSVPLPPSRPVFLRLSLPVLVETRLATPPALPLNVERLLLPSEVETSDGLRAVRAVSKGLTGEEGSFLLGLRTGGGGGGLDGRGRGGERSWTVVEGQGGRSVGSRRGGRDGASRFGGGSIGESLWLEVIWVWREGRRRLVAVEVWRRVVERGRREGVVRLMLRSLGGC